MNSARQISLDCYALLDDCDASSAAPRSRLYTGHVGTLSCQSVVDLPVLLEQMQQALLAGRFAVGLFSYELGAAMQEIAAHAEVAPWAQILLFDQCRHFSVEQVEDWLQAQQAAPQSAGIANVHASIDQMEFSAAVARIQQYIDAGDTYQVNYTYRLHCDAYGSLTDLYLRLRASQPVPYGALIRLPDDRAILSLSPELFMQQAQGHIIARPMKGTAAAKGDRAEVASAALSGDPKNRAENLMIVDLLRNDLGRVAQFGSVQVPKLFEVTRYGSVLQMTSTITARLRETVSLPEIFSALYPCGSITGAPKHRTMQIIRELEPQARGMYTGAIGWFDAADQVSGKGIGDFCLSVPIRTLMLQAPGSDGVRRGEMGVGAGIVHDSVAAQEYAECQLKARFLTGLPHEFELFETMFATQEDGCRNLDRHLQRLAASAAYFGFIFDEKIVRAKLREACVALPPQQAQRVRLALHPSGVTSVRTAPLQALPQPVKVLLASQPTQANDLFLRHKTSVRTVYDAAWKTAEAQGAFDMLFFNTRGELTEGARCNVLVKLDGKWFTPPLDAGVLPGVMRSVLLADPVWDVCERRLNLQDLRRAEEVVVCNALRGALAVQVIWGA